MWNEFKPLIEGDCKKGGRNIVPVASRPLPPKGSETNNDTNGKFYADFDLVENDCIGAYNSKCRDEGFPVGLGVIEGIMITFEWLKENNYRLEIEG